MLELKAALEMIRAESFLCQVRELSGVEHGSAQGHHRVRNINNPDRNLVLLILMVITPHRVP